MPARILFISALLACVSATAVAASPVPDFPSNGVATSGLDDDTEASLDDLRTFLSNFRSEAGARYHVAVVAYVDDLDRGGVEYGGAAAQYVVDVFNSWIADLDPARSVVLVLSTENRGIGVRQGSEWAELGFEGLAVTDVIDGSSFGQYAGGGEYGLALADLIQHIDGRLVTLAGADGGTSCASPPEFVGVPSGRAPWSTTADGYTSGDTRTLNFGDELVVARGEGGMAAVSLYAVNDCGLWIQVSAHDGYLSGEPRLRRPTYHAIPLSGDTVTIRAGELNQDGNHFAFGVGAEDAVFEVTVQRPDRFAVELVVDIAPYQGE